MFVLDTNVLSELMDVKVRTVYWKRLGRPVGIIDSQVAAIVRSTGMTIVTRDVSHFQDCGIPIVDPWKPE